MYNVFIIKISIKKLSAKRFVSVSTFKSNKLVNIREYYNPPNSEKLLPGKKGISLNKDQWKNLMKYADKINKIFESEE